MRVLATLLIGGLGGLGGYMSGVPAGAMLGAIVAVGAVNLGYQGFVQVPSAARVLGRILVGTAIGSLVTIEVVRAVGESLVWAVVFTLVVLATGIGSGFVLSRWSGLDLRTSLIACCPGGMPEMTALADELGAEVDVVVGIHLARKILTLVTVAGAIILLGLA